MSWLTRLSDYLALTLFMLLTLSSSTVNLTKPADKVHILASDYAFDLASWMVDAAWLKMNQSAMAAPRYFAQPTQHDLVREYLQLVEDLQQTEYEINLLYADPSQNDPDAASADLRATLNTLTRRQKALAPLAEAVLEMQVTVILDEIGLTVGGQPIPWVLYHTTPLPQNLVVSSRNLIQQETSYILQPGLTTEQAVALEAKIDAKMNVSSLVVQIGGLAAYPTMIMRTTALNWLSNTIAHEWIHLYLGQRPLGMNYDRTPQLRTMNETTASIAGDEIGRIVIERYYPELARRYRNHLQLAALGAGPIPPGSYRQPFDFRAEMHKTRVRADELLAAGQIDEAEAYMEARRAIFWENGYAIRKLNQAYFAFHGAYADVPGGAAGEDPVGPAVRQLRAESASLRDFLDHISQMDTFEELLTAIQE